MTVKVSRETVIAGLAERQRTLYGSPDIEAMLQRIIQPGPSRLSTKEVQDMLRSARAVLFDTHVAVVSGHHTATYLRFESIARFPHLMRRLADDMAEWILQAYSDRPLTGILVTNSAAARLAEGVAAALQGRRHLRVTLTPYSDETGRIGTDIMTGAVYPGDHFLALNDVTTRGNCVSKLGNVITDRGATLVGMMVFARRDSGQFPLVRELTTAHPFYYTTDLYMPQWEPEECPLCRKGQPLLSWRDMPEL